MGRKRMTSKDEKMHIGGIYEAHLAAKFDYLCKMLGVAKQEALRRLIIQALRDKSIPGVVPFEFTYEENASAPFDHTKEAASSTGTKVLHE